MFCAPTTTFFVRPVNPAANGVGFFVATNAAPLTLTFADHPCLVGQAWNGFSTANTTIYVVEEFFIPIEG